MSAVLKVTLKTRALGHDVIRVSSPRWRVATVLAMAAGLLATGLPAQADPSVGTPVAPATGAVTGTGTVTTDQLAASQAAATTAQQQATTQAALLADATAKIAALQTQVDDAHAASEVAADVARNARAEAATQQARADEAAQVAKSRKAELGRWASAAYRSGTSAGGSSLVTLMESENTDDLAQNLQSQQMVGRWRGTTSKEVTTAATEQKRAAQAASDAALEAEQAQAAADAATKQADAAVAAQQTEIAKLTAALTSAQANATAAQQASATLAAQQAAQQAATNARQQAANVPAANLAAQAAEVAALTPGSTNERIIATAKSLQGIPYNWGGTTPAGFDCSGYTSYVYRQVGLSIPRTAAQQQAYLIPVSDPQPGDLVFFGSRAHHVGIYAGGGMMYDSPSSGKTTGLHKVYSGVSGYGRLAG